MYEERAHYAASAAGGASGASSGREWFMMKEIQQCQALWSKQCPSSAGTTSMIESIMSCKKKQAHILFSFSNRFINISCSMSETVSNANETYYVPHCEELI